MLCYMVFLWSLLRVISLLYVVVYLWSLLRVISSLYVVICSLSPLLLPPIFESSSLPLGAQKEKLRCATCLYLE